MPKSLLVKAHTWSVRVQLVDTAGNKLAERTVRCQALDPGAACASAYVVARAEIHVDYQKRNQEIPRVHAVSFLVLANNRGGR